MRKAHKNLVRKFQRNKPLARVVIEGKMMLKIDLIEVGCKSVNWIKLFQGRSNGGFL
jgi:hypothetical protein